MEITATLPTDSGMHLIWDREQFRGVSDYETWSQELEEDPDIARHIALGHVVPINIHSDGAWAIKLRIDPDQTPSLTEDEQHRVVVSSMPYLFVCGVEMCVSGIEHVSGEPETRRVLTANVQPGRYEATVHLLDYDDIQPKTDAHPDFIVLLGPVRSTSFRRSIDTFDR
jgi:hypothetical protein